MQTLSAHLAAPDLALRSYTQQATSGSEIQTVQCQPPQLPVRAAKCLLPSIFLRGCGSSRLRSSVRSAGQVAVQSAAGSWPGKLVRAETAGERPIWLPGSTPPDHLDGSLPGDFGFDPLGLGEDPEDLKWYVQAELVHARFAMAGVAGVLATDILRVSGLKDLPVWYEAGATKFDFAETKTLFLIQLILFAFVETKRYMDFKTPGSQATEDSVFFGLEELFEGLAPGYPGGPLFNPLGLASDLSKAKPLQTKELKNGRLAMVAALGFFVQAYATKQGPVENLLAHLSDPWHTTVVQTVTAAFAS